MTGAGIFGRGVFWSSGVQGDVPYLLSCWHSWFILVILPSPWLSLFCSPGGSLVESPNWASTMEAPCLLALKSSASWVPHGMGWGAVGRPGFSPGHIETKQSLGKPFFKANRWALRSLMWAALGWGGEVHSRVRYGIWGCSSLGLPTPYHSEEWKPEWEIGKQSQIAFHAPPSSAPRNRRGGLLLPFLFVLSPSTIR